MTLTNVQNYDVAVIGGGPGGYVAAIRLAQLGKKIVLIEKNDLGGVCLNWGCIPTKSLLKSVEVLDYAKHAASYGINILEVKFDFKAIMNRSRVVAKNLSKGVEYLLKKNKVKVIAATAKMLNNQTIELTNINGEIEQITVKNTIIATGAKPRILKGFEFDQQQIWSSKEAIYQEELPKSMVIVGSGAIGIEFASFYNALGVEVSVIEMHDRILLSEDLEIAIMAKTSFESKGIKFYLNSKLISQKDNSGHLEISLEFEGKTITLIAEKLLMAIGVIGNTENIGLENTKIKWQNNCIATDEFMRTDDSYIYAIGDVTKGPWLAHKASHEGIIAAEHIAGLSPHPINTRNIPGCIYSSPQIASVGLTEDQALKNGYKVRVGRFPLSANGKAQVMGKTEGLIKTIFDEATGELLGAHLIGCEVTELISNFTLARTLEATEHEILNTIFPHPTLSEALPESIMEAFKRPIHI